MNYQGSVTFDLLDIGCFEICLSWIKWETLNRGHLTIWQTSLILLAVCMCVTLCAYLCVFRACLFTFVCMRLLLICFCLCVYVVLHSHQCVCVCVCPRVFLCGCSCLIAMVSLCKHLRNHAAWWLISLFAVCVCVRACVFSPFLSFPDMTASETKRAAALFEERED